MPPLTDPDPEPAALAATRAELAALRDPPVPPELARRWAAAIEAEHAAGTAAPPGAPKGDDPAAGSVCRLHDHRSGDPSHAPEPAIAHPDRDRRPDGSRHRGRGAGRSPLWRRPAVLAAAVLAAVVVAATLTHRSAPDVGPRTLVADGVNSVGVHDTGVYDDPARRSACLRALSPPGVADGAPLVGGRRVTWNGRDGVLLVLGTGRRGVFDIVVVDPGCTVLLAAAHAGG